MGKIAWCITGAAHFLKESVTLLEGFKGVDLFISRAGKEVLSMYGITPSIKPLVDKSSSAITCRGFYSGEYDLLVIAPATTNSVAKFVYGISDSTISTLFAQAGKAGVPIIVLPSDTDSVIETMGVTKLLKVIPRSIDMENYEKLKIFPGVKVADNCEELANFFSNTKK